MTYQNHLSYRAYFLHLDLFVAIFGPLSAVPPRRSTYFPQENISVLLSADNASKLISSSHAFSVL